jgi:nucleotide-binding universal stress UspA family protein
MAAHSGPVVLAYDGQASTEVAITEAAEVLAERRAVVVVIWKQGIGLESVLVPAMSGGDLPPAELDVRTASEFDEAMSGRARQLAEHGATIAREAGFDAEGLTVADSVDVTVAETLLDVARSHDAPAIVLGSHGHGPVVGSTTRDVLRHASCPVLVRRGARAQG